MLSVGKIDMANDEQGVRKVQSVVRVSDTPLRSPLFPKVSGSDALTCLSCPNLDIGEVRESELSAERLY